MAKISDLYKEFEAKRTAASIDAEVQKKIEDIEFDIYLYECALEHLVSENIEDIKVLDGKFVFVFKDDLDLYQLLGMETPEGVEIYANDWGFRIGIECSGPEMLDGYFGMVVIAVENIIDDLKQRIATLEGQHS